MTLFSSPRHRQQAELITDLAYCNPFEPRRFELERKLLGARYVPVTSTALAKKSVMAAEDANLDGTIDASARLAEECRTRLTKEDEVSPEDADQYESVALFLLFHRYLPRFDHQIEAETEPRRSGTRRTPRITFFGEFERDWHYYLDPLLERRPDFIARRGGESGESSVRAVIAHTFACMVQMRRAFHHIFNAIIGESAPITRLRAAVWQSIFTHDLGRYRRHLFARMGDIPCLIVGPSGTGKELVARAIGLSRYRAFDPEKGEFRDDVAEAFYPLNISALSPTLVESELFGHRRGAYTGAVTDRVGWLEVSPAQGTVFLDEIGELDPVIQVKLLRVLQSRVFQRLGETEDRVFRGKIVAATNQHLARMMAEGRFRRDFYFRLCADMIRTPSLQEQLADAPDSLGVLVRYLAAKLIGEEEADVLTAEVLERIAARLGTTYAWPGNVRELEQCIRAIIIRRDYAPDEELDAEGRSGLFPGIDAGTMTADELLSRYFTLVYSKAGSYQEAARRLGVDHRTVKAKIDESLLSQLQDGSTTPDDADTSA